MCESITILIPRLNPLVWIQHLAKVRNWLLAKNIKYKYYVADPSHSLWFSDGYIRKFAPLQPRTLGGSCFFRRHITGLLIIGVIWSTPSETLGNKTYHSSCPGLMSSARFEVTWLNKNIQFLNGPLKLFERAVKKSSVFIMLVKLCYPTGNARVSDNNDIYMIISFWIIFFTLMAVKTIFHKKNYIIHHSFIFHWLHWHTKHMFCHQNQVSMWHRSKVMGKNVIFTCALAAILDFRQYIFFPKCASLAHFWLVSK